MIFLPEPSALVVEFRVLRACDRTLWPLLLGLPVLVQPSAAPEVAQGGAADATRGSADRSRTPENKIILFLFTYKFGRWWILKISRFVKRAFTKVE